MKKKLFLIVTLSLTIPCFASSIQAQWRQIVAPGLIIGGLGTIGNYLLAGTDQGTFRSSDYGNTWKKAKGTNYPLEGFATMGKNFFACNGYVFLSTDSGANWINVGSGSDNNTQCITVLGSTLFAAGYFFGTWYSVDSGKSWHDVEFAYHRISCLAANDSTVFEGGASGVSRFNTVNKNWTPLGPGASTLCYADTNLYAGTVVGVIRYNNIGTNWTAINHGLKDTNVNTIISYDSKLFIASNEGVFYSSDHGTNWNSLNKGLPNDTGFRSLAIVGGFLFVGTPGATYIQVGNGIWRRSLSDLADVKEKPPQPDLNFYLSPNPTTGIITVHNAPANILHITVSSILGESVIELPHPNAPEFTLDLSKLPPGTYFARFSLENEVITRKIIKE